MQWLHDIARSLTDEGIQVADLLPTAEQRRALLDVARVAAHTSGERTNAPLLCYVLGRAAERGISLEDAIAAIDRVTSDG